MLYASIGTGYKSGGFNDPLLNLADPIFQPEEILAVQLGHKTQFSDGRLQINSELFWYDYTDMQVNQIVNLLNIVQNASSSKIFGLDTEIIAAPTDNWLLRLSVTYLNTEYENFTAFDAVTGEFEDMDGKDLVKAPEWSLFGGIEYTFEFANGWRLIPQIAVSYESESKRRVVSDPGALQPAYTRTNANLALESSDGSWEVQAFVTNIEDDFVATGVGLNGNNERTISGQPPRMYGVRVRYGFGE